MKRQKLRETSTDTLKKLLAAANKDNSKTVLQIKKELKQRGEYVKSNKSAYGIRRQAAKDAAVKFDDTQG